MRHKLRPPCARFKIAPLVSSRFEENRASMPSSGDRVGLYTSGRIQIVGRWCPRDSVRYVLQILVTYAPWKVSSGTVQPPAYGQGVTGHALPIRRMACITPITGASRLPFVAAPASSAEACDCGCAMRNQKGMSATTEDWRCQVSIARVV